VGVNQISQTTLLKKNFVGTIEGPALYSGTPKKIFLHKKLKKLTATSCVKDSNNLKIDRLVINWFSKKLTLLYRK